MSVPLVCSCYGPWGVVSSVLEPQRKSSIIVTLPKPFSIIPGASLIYVRIKTKKKTKFPSCCSVYRSGTSSETSFCFVLDMCVTLQEMSASLQSYINPESDLDGKSECRVCDRDDHHRACTSESITRLLRAMYLCTR